MPKTCEKKLESFVNNKVLLCDRKRRTACCVACSGGGEGREGYPCPTQGWGGRGYLCPAWGGREGKEREGTYPSPAQGGGTPVLPRGEEGEGEGNGEGGVPLSCLGRGERDTHVLPEGEGWVPLCCLLGGEGEGRVPPVLSMGTPCLPTPPPLPVTRQDTSENT